MSHFNARVMPKAYTTFETPIGLCGIVWSERGISAVQLPERTPVETVEHLLQRFGTNGNKPIKSAKIPAEVKQVIEFIQATLRGESHPQPKVDLDLDAVPQFHKKIYRAAMKIRAGETATYGQLAKSAGSPGAARAVGQAMAKNPLPLIVPCHRVLGSNGKMVGFSAFGGCEIKTKLLEIEKPVEKKPQRRFKQGRGSKFSFDPEEALTTLAKQDPTMGRLISLVGDFALQLDEMMTPYEALAESIVYQQLTGKAAATIFDRVKNLCGDPLIPRSILKASDQDLRGAGLSSAKAAALRDLSQKELDGQIPDLAELAKMSDPEIIQHLIAVRGIGRWTVEMLLIFRLGRPDVLPVHDYGIRKGYAFTYNKKELPTPKDLEKFGARWAPYRSIASWYLWRSLELPPHKVPLLRGRGK